MPNGGFSMRLLLTICLALFTATMTARPAAAGCGCDKPPPPPADVRPHATYAGMPVTIFHPTLKNGGRYVVAFRSGIGGATSVVTADAVSRRDLGDGRTKPQLVVALPALPLGPAAIEVYTQEPARAPLLSAGDDQFTVVAAPVRLPDGYGRWALPDFRAAVGRDGTTYVALDLSALRQPMVFQAQAKGYALRFGGDDVVFYNTQGFLMQLIFDVGTAEPIPGMFVYPSSSTADGDILSYSRHEFSTYFLQHAERQKHELAGDPNWHRDGTRHVDHDHLILAIGALLPGGAAPAAGATPPFTLSVTTHSLFSKGLVGAGDLTVDDNAAVDSYDPESGAAGCGGDVASNGAVALLGNAFVCGDAAGAQISMSRGATLRGDAYRVVAPSSFMDVKVPDGITDLRDVTVLALQKYVIRGPGSFRVRNLNVLGLGRLYVDNSAGPVTLYVTGKLTIALGGVVITASSDPEQFATYVAGNDTVRIYGLGSERFNGVLYAPYSYVDMGSGDFYGAFVAGGLRAGGSARIHYDETLRMPVDLGTDPADEDFVGTEQEGILSLVGPLTGVLAPALR
jgi:hypothetical protein